MTMVKINGIEMPEDALIANGLDEAIIGYDDEAGKVIYSYDKCISIFMKQDMDYDEAVEWMEFNVVGAYVGPKTPIFVDDYDDEALDVG